MKTIVLLLIMTVMIILSSGCMFPLSNLAGENFYLTYNNTIEQYSLQYPSNWRIWNSTDMSIVKLTHPLEYNDQGNLLDFRLGTHWVIVDVSVYSEPIASNTTLDDYVRSNGPVRGKVLDGGLRAISIDEQSNVTLSGLPAKKFVYTSLQMQTGDKLKRESTYFVRDDRVFRIVYSADLDKFDDIHPIATKIMNSLTFIA